MHIVDMSQGEHFRLEWKKPVFNVQSFIVRVEKGESIPLHSHDDHEQFYFVLQGHGMMTVGSEEKRVGPNMMIHIPLNTQHRMAANENELVTYLNFTLWEVLSAK